MTTTNLYLDPLFYCMDREETKNIGNYGRQPITLNSWESAYLPQKDFSIENLLHSSVNEVNNTEKDSLSLEDIEKFFVDFSDENIVQIPRAQIEPSTPKAEKTKHKKPKEKRNTTESLLKGTSSFILARA